MTRWRLVPVEPTEGMVVSGGQAHDAEDAAQRGEPSPWTVNLDDPDMTEFVADRAAAMTQAYAAMLAASPPPDEALVEAAANELRLTMGFGDNPMDAARAVLAMFSGEG